MYMNNAELSSFPQVLTTHAGAFELTKSMHRRQKYKDAYRAFIALAVRQPTFFSN